MIIKKHKTLKNYLIKFTKILYFQKKKYNNFKIKNKFKKMNINFYNKIKIQPVN